jgi:alpha-glucosidase
VKISSAGKFHVAQKLAQVTVLGVAKKPTSVSVGGKAVKFTYASAQQKVVLTGLSVDLNKGATIEWK